MGIPSNHNMTTSYNRGKIGYAKLEFHGAKHQKIGIRSAPEYPGNEIGKTITAANGLIKVYSNSLEFKFHEYIILFYQLVDEEGWIHDFQPDFPSHRTIKIFDSDALPSFFSC